MHVLLLETIEDESFELLKNEKDIQLHLAWEGMPVAEVRALYKECSALKFKYNPLNNLKCTGTMARRLVI